MRALLSTIGSRGDVQPLVSLAVQLRALGHEARLCVPPDFREWIEGFGIEVTPIGPEVRRFVPSTPAAPPSADQLRRMMDGTVATQFETITSAAHGCDVILGATALQIAARSVAEKMGIPYVFAAYCPVVLPSLHHAPAPLPARGPTPPVATEDTRELWRRNAERFNESFRAPLNSHRAALGLPPVDDVRSYMFTERPWLAADATLAPWPDAAASNVFQPGAWILDDDRPLPRELTAFLDGGEPPLHFGFGSVHAPSDIGHVMIQSARALGRRAIVSAGWAELSVDGQPDCITIGEVNVRTLFTRVAAVVHHGGAGTTTFAALAGTPQVVIPHVYDQSYWARRIQELGAGVAHPSTTPTVESLTSALGDVLRPAVAARARSVAGSLRTDGALVAARRLIAEALHAENS